MSDLTTINVIEQLKPFLNDKGVLEIVSRGKDQKFREFHNVLINELSNSQESETLKSLVTEVKKNVNISELNMKQLDNIANIGNLNLILSGVNLCATCAGFAIMYAKLEKMSTEIDQKLREIQKNVKDIQDINVGYRFKTVISEHSDMLDRIKVHKPYSEEQMRELVDTEYNLLSMLIESLEKDVSNDNRQLILSIVSLAAMLAATLKNFDEQYYFNNKEAIDNKEYWHASHNTWMGIFDTLSSQWFIENLQDHAILEQKLDTRCADIFYESLLEQIRDMSQSIKDNMKLIQLVDNQEIFQALKEYSDQEIIEIIGKAIQKVSANSNDPAFESACEKAVQAIA